MKNFLLTLAFAFLTNLGYSQKLKINSNKQITIDSTIHYDSISSKDLYNTVKKWAISNIENAKESTIYDTPEEIQFRYRQKVTSNLGGGWNITRTLTVKLKNGKINVEFSKMSTTNIGGTTSIENILLKNNGTFRIANTWTSMMAGIEEQFKLVIEGISNSIKAQKEIW